MYFSVPNGAYLTIGTVLATVQYTHHNTTTPQNVRLSRLKHLFGHKSNKELKSDSQDRIYEIKCIGCDVGEFVKTHCNEPMGKSQCKPCPRGTFSTTPGGATSCQHCTPCSHGVDKTSDCNATSNTGCACPKGKVPNIVDGWTQNCMEDEATASASTTTEYETTTTDPVTPSQEYKPRTTHVPPSNGYETKPSDYISVVTAVMVGLIGGLIVGFILGVVFLIVILRRCTETRWPSIIAKLRRCIGGRWSYNEVPRNY